MKDREFEIEDAYQIFALFMQHFWWNHLRHVMIKKGLINEGLTPEEFEQADSIEQGKSELSEANYFVFCVIPGDPCGCGSYLEKVIEKRLHISNSRSKGSFKVNEKVLFQLIIDFCDFLNNQFKSYPKNSMGFAINWLEEMRKHPEEHKQEWEIWSECIHDVVIDGYKSSASFSK